MDIVAPSTSQNGCTVLILRGSATRRPHEHVLAIAKWAHACARTIPVSGSLSTTRSGSAARMGRRRIRWRQGTRRRVVRPPTLRYLGLMAPMADRRDGVPPAARVRLLRDPQPVGPGQRPPARAARLSARSRPPAPGSPGRWAGRTTACRSRRRWRTCARSPARSTCRSTPTSRAASRSSPAQVGANVSLAAGDRDRRALDRGLHGRRRASAVRLRPRGRAGAGGARGDRRQRHGRAAHRPLGGLHRRPAGPRRDDPPAHRLRRGGRGLPVRAGTADPGRDRAGGGARWRPSR